MDEKRYALSGAGGLSLSTADADKLINAGDSAAALLYIYLLRTGGVLSARAASQALGMPKAELARATDVLARLNLLTETHRLPPADELPEYSAEEIAQRSQENENFSVVIHDAARIYGRRLSTQETKTLFGIYDYLGLPPEVILLLLNHCVARYRAKNGPGRLPSMRSIEKEAFVWANREITTLEQAEAHLRHLAERQSTINQVRQLLGLRDRELSPSERRYIEQWLELGFSPDAIAIAYDRTVVQKGALVWSYMNGIIRRWEEKGLHTPEEIATGDAKRPLPEPAGHNGQTDTGGDLERLKKIYDRVKNG